MRTGLFLACDWVITGSPIEAWQFLIFCKQDTKALIRMSRARCMDTHPLKALCSPLTSRSGFLRVVPYRIDLLYGEESLNAYRLEAVIVHAGLRGSDKF